MASLFDSLSSAINPEIVSALGKALGADTSAINQGLAAAAPLLMGSMTKMASTPTGAESLLKMLPQDTGGLLGGFGSLTSLISNLFSGGPTGNSMLSSLMGPGLNAIGGSLTKALGFQRHAPARHGGSGADGPGQQGGADRQARPHWTG